MKVTQVLLLFGFLAICGAIQFKKHRHSKSGYRFLERLTAERSPKSGLYPDVVDAALTAHAEATATCGDLGPEEFCRILSAKASLEHEVCDVCDGASGTYSRRHPADFALDSNSETWWQSPSMLQGDENQNVNFTITLQDEMEIVYLVVRAGPSPRPAAWAVEMTREHEGGWVMVKSFARDSEECERLWGVKRRKENRAKRKPRENMSTLECYTKFSNIKPVENGEIHVPINVGAAGFTARRVRLVLRGLHNANTLEQRFYTLRSVTVAARCQCYGHADSCGIVNGKTFCTCQHNTCGEHCERCCDGGEWSVEKECKTCPCASRALTCHQTQDGYQCFNCTDNRAGDQCDECLPGYFSLAPGEPCVPCSCNSIGATGDCYLDPESGQQICQCKKGYSGAGCQGCSDGFTGYPECTYCKCDVRGSEDPSSSCESNCECRKHVTGRLCDLCASGYYGLSEALDDGCRPCYCSGVTNECSSSSDVFQQFEFKNRWIASDATGAYVVIPTHDKDGYPFINADEFIDVEAYYWSSNNDFVGDRLEWYGTRLVYRLKWRVMRGDAGGEPIQMPDVVLVGADNAKIAYGNNLYHKAGDVTEFYVSLHETGWYHFINPTDNYTTSSLRNGDSVSHFQFMDILSDVKSVLLRAKFHQDQTEVRLESAEIRGGDPSLIEHCACSIGYAGKSCQNCAKGYRKIPLPISNEWSLQKFECVMCDCNGHSVTCTDGYCDKCEHNTTGSHCERCLAGFYGNPLKGTPSDCLPCACPSFDAKNNFSPNCALVEKDRNDYVCTQCPEGFAGIHCEKCDIGYWGDPTAADGRCLPCACGGAPCDPINGECLACAVSSPSDRCALCQEDYWFSDNVCVPCDCGVGALSATCDVITGQCFCDSKYTGRTCDLCLNGSGDGCFDCGGTLPTPTTCSPCTPSADGLIQDGCSRCNCSRLGSYSQSCDIVTGQCACKPHVTGLHCDQCEAGFWNMGHSGCEPCRCAGAASSCHPRTGECLCKPGVEGPRCDTCQPGFYGFGSSGCLACPACQAGHVCDQLTGQCTCLTSTMGADCQKCRPGFWGFVPDNGCKPCLCSRLGAIGTDCNLEGECACRAGWTGARCDTCARGFFGPRCRQCSCHIAGTTLGACDEDGTHCYCDESGQCPCKESVTGLKCDTCRNGTFGLSSWKKSGCTQCYCFGRTSHCTQAGLTKTYIRSPAPRKLANHNRSDAPTRNLTVTMSDEYSPLSNDDGLKVIPGTSGDVNLPTESSTSYLDAPLYWELGIKFRGDHVTSYGGELLFSAEDAGEERFSQALLRQYPLAQIRAHSSIFLDYYEHEYHDSPNYAARLHESLWKVRRKNSNVSAPISRAGLMVALQGIERIFVRATTHAKPKIAILHNASMDSAIEIQGRPPPLADGVEMCSCPAAYGSSSCQEAANGFWIPHKNISIDENTDIITINVLGDAYPCNCNGRSRFCDRVTGACVNCSKNSGGPHCEICADGFFGSPEDPNGCQPCPCPSLDNNNAVSCRHGYHGHIECRCRTGYAGRSCSECEKSYRRQGHQCVACNCDAAALGPECDAKGQCKCPDTMSGLRCQYCLASRHYFDGRQCTGCDNCIKWLLDSIEEQSKQLNYTILIPPPVYLLNMINNRLQSLKIYIDGLLVALDKYSSDQITNYFETLWNRLADQSTLANARLSDAKRILKESGMAQNDINHLRADLDSVISQLHKFAHVKRHLNINTVANEVKSILRLIKTVDLSHSLSSVGRISDHANSQYHYLNETLKKINDIERQCSRLLERLDFWHNKADDLKKLNSRIWNAVDVIEATDKNVKNSLVNIELRASEIKKRFDDTINNLFGNKTRETEMAVESAVNLLKQIPALKEESKVNMGGAEIKEGILYSLIPTYKTKYLEKAEQHVKNLTDFAATCKRLFSETLKGHESIVKASSSYSDIAAAIKSAKEIAGKSLRSCGRTQKAMSELPHKAQFSLSRSLLQNRATNQHLEKFEDLTAAIEKLHLKVERIGIEIRGIGWKDRELSTISSSLIGLDVSGVLSGANEKSTRVYENMRSLYEEADNISQLVRYQLQPKLQELLNQGDDVIGGAEENVSQIRSNIIKNNVLATSLLEAAHLRRIDVENANHTFASMMAKLKSSIFKARHILNSIKISLTSPRDGYCLRGYKLTESSATTINRISIDFSINYEDVMDSVLFFISNHKRRQFIKVEIVERRVRFSWRLGDNFGTVTHPELLQSDGAGDNGQIFFRAEAERIWDACRLLVKRRQVINNLSKTEEKVVYNSSDHNKGDIFQLRKGDVIWVGGTNEKSQVGLSACIQQISLDEKQIGLWNFDAQPVGATCVGCSEGYDVPKLSDDLSMYHFNGAGYAQLARSTLQPYNRRQFSISLTFRTFDEDALLFLAFDEINNRTVALELRDCRVVFRVEYGLQWFMEITSKGRHCNGKKIKVQAARAFLKSRQEKGSLRVNGEEILGSPEPSVSSAAFLPDLSRTYWLGGVPPGAHIAHSRRPIYGCLGDLRVDQEFLDPFTSTSHYGVEASCSGRLIGDSTFEGDGYVELPAQSLGRKSQFGFMFRADQPSALLVYSAPIETSVVFEEADNEVVPHYEYTSGNNLTTYQNLQENLFYSISLLKGNLVVMLNAGKGTLVLSSNDCYLGDGRFHAVKLVKSGKKVDVHVDGQIVGHGLLVGGGVGLLSKTSLFVGGIPESIRRNSPTEDRVATSNGLNGTLKDIVFDGKVISFDSMLSSHRAILGRLRAMTKSNEATQDDNAEDLEENRCGILVKSNLH